MHVTEGRPCRNAQGEDSPLKMAEEICHAVTSHMKTWSYQKLEKARKNPSLKASDTAWPCKHLDFGLLTSKTMR